MAAMTDTDLAVSRLGWHSAVPPNGFANRPAAPTTSNSNPLGLATPENEIETTPEHRNLTAGDPSSRQTDLIMAQQVGGTWGTNRVIVGCSLT